MNTIVLKEVKEESIEENSVTAIDSSKDSAIIIPDDTKDKDTLMAKIGRWGSMLFNFLKALLFGLCVFIYDMYSKSQIQLKKLRFKFLSVKRMINTKCYP